MGGESCVLLSVKNPVMHQPDQLQDYYVCYMTEYPNSNEHKAWYTLHLIPKNNLSSWHRMRFNATNDCYDDFAERCVEIGLMYEGNSQFNAYYKSLFEYVKP